MINKVILVGNLGADPEAKTSKGGLVICNIRLATSSRVKRGDTWEEETEWHRVVCFGKTAENCGRYLSKGSRVYIEGRLKTNKWQDKDGNDRYTTEVIAYEVKFLTPKSEGGQQQSRGSQQHHGASQAPSDDIPF